MRVGIMGAMPGDARVHPRYGLPMQADVLGEEVVMGRAVADISLGGCRFRGQGWENVDTEIELVLSFPTLGTNLPLGGVVVRSNHNEMAIKFRSLSDEQKWALRKHLREAEQIPA